MYVRIPFHYTIHDQSKQALKHTGMGAGLDHFYTQIRFLMLSCIPARQSCVLTRVCHMYVSAYVEVPYVVVVAVYVCVNVFLCVVDRLMLPGIPARIL